MAKKGFAFPTKFGFSGSTGKVQQVRGHTRRVPKKAIGGVMTPNLVRGAALSQARAPMRPLTPPPNPGRVIAPPPGKVPGRVLGAAPAGPPMRNTGYRGPLDRAYADGGFVKTKKPISDVTIGDQGNSVTKRGNPPISEFDVDHGGRSPLRPGYKKGGKAKRRYAEGGGVSAVKAREIAHDVVGMHVAKPAPKGHKGFERMPMFGKHK